MSTPYEGHSSIEALHAARAARESGVDDRVSEKCMRDLIATHHDIIGSIRQFSDEQALRLQLVVEQAVSSMHAYIATAGLAGLDQASSAFQESTLMARSAQELPRAPVSLVSEIRCRLLKVAIYAAALGVVFGFMLAVAGGSAWLLHK